MFYLLADTATAMDGAYYMALLSRVLHISTAMILVGGLFYLRAIVLKSVNLANSGDGMLAEAYFGTARKKWAMIVMAATLFSLASGLYNFFTIRAGYNLVSKYQMLFGIKFLLGLFVYFVAAFMAGKTSGAESARAKGKFWLNLAIVAALAIIILAAMMRTEPFRGSKKTPVAQSVPEAQESEAN